MPRVQIALVSEQAPANLLPILDPALTPDEVFLLVTGKMRVRSQALAEVIRESGKGISVKFVEIQNEQSFQAIQEKMLGLTETLVGSDVHVNLTGGTKLMSLAAYSIAEVSGWTAFYLDLDSRSIVWVSKKRPPQPLTVKIGLNHYLRGYGIRLASSLERPADSAERAALTEFLVNNARTLEQPIGSLNYLCQRAEKTLNALMDEKQKADANFQQLLDKFGDAGFLSLKSRDISFDSEKSRKFVHGGWIEHHVYHAVKSVPKDYGVRDLAVNLQLLDMSGQPNELDVAFVANDRLYMVECKTMRMDDPEKTKANDTLYKIAENRRRIGGFTAKAMLVTYRSLRDSEIHLAKALDIKVVQGHQLTRLSEELRTWISPR